MVGPEVLSHNQLLLIGYAKSVWHNLLFGYFESQLPLHTSWVITFIGPAIFTLAPHARIFLKWRKYYTDSSHSGHFEDFNRKQYTTEIFLAP